MKLYTKRGDDGTTGLIGGSRVRKDDIRVAAYGDVDETSAAIGLAIAASDDDAARILRQVQADLFALGAELATQPGRSPQVAMANADIDRLEQWIDQATAETAPLKNFVLPGGSEAASRLHAARTVCRRAERAVVALAGAQTVGPLAVAYLNRLSDLLFALARRANKRAGIADVPWIVADRP